MVRHRSFACIPVPLALLFLAQAASGMESMVLEDVVVFDKVDDFPVTIQATSGDDRPIQAFAISVRFDPEVLEIAEFSPAGEWLQTGAPDFVRSVGTRSSPGEPGLAGLVVVVGVSDGQHIPAKPDGALQPIARLTVAPRYGPGLWSPLVPARLYFADGGARFGQGPGMYNSLVIEGMDFYAGTPESPLFLQHGSIRIIRRGDSNADGEVDISDAIHLLSWLFLGGPEPPCRQLVYINSDDTIDIADAIFIFSYLFTGGEKPLPATSCS